MRKTLMRLLLAVVIIAVVTACASQKSSTDISGKAAAPDATGPSASAESEELDIAAYHDFMKENIIETLNNSATSTIYNRTLDSQEEFDSIYFYDFYFIDKNQERNGNSNFVVRYTMNYDELPNYTSIISFRYNLPQDMLYEVFIKYTQYADTLPELMDYLYENRDEIEENGYDFNQAMGDSHVRDKEGCFLSYDAETFYYYMAGTTETK